MPGDERLAKIEERLKQQDALIVGLKKEVGVLRRQLRGNGKEPERTTECRLGLGDECTRASTYQYQQGCGGEACKTARAEYYNKPKDETVVEKPKRMMKRARS